MAAYGEHRRFIQIRDGENLDYAPVIRFDSKALPGTGVAPGPDMIVIPRSDAGLFTEKSFRLRKCVLAGMQARKGQFIDPPRRASAILREYDVGSKI